MRILLIEDDTLIGDGLSVGLKKLGFAVDWFTNGLDGRDALFLAPYDAVILDLGLPDMDGLSILKEWRKNGRADPVLILTAQGDVDQRVVGLESGADDYLPKPFALKEVAARLNALNRRHHETLKTVITFGVIQFHPDTKEVFSGKKRISLSHKELLLLELFLSNKGRVLPKSLIEEKLYSWDGDVQSNAIEVHVHHLRRKLGKNIVKTVNKVGYILGDA